MISRKQSPTALNKRGTKVYLDGFTFDSQKEADFYERFIKFCGYDYDVHPRYHLTALTSIGPVKVPSISYTPDFVVYDEAGHIKHVYDVKNSFGVYGIDGSVKLRFKLFALNEGLPVEAVVVRKHDFKVKLQGTTKSKKEPVVTRSIDYDWTELI
ncbi:DUF1064 domain-containing protein [Lactiplantibacillus pentosus]|uniref:DUF1064 domain-containing protein n=1 Tax=Lactiplantibacillus pentosus TaxID=1589 RepID=UPI001330404B|nr:DUF1064 domain-containing protein [Lactiplantibacillus pentosus]MBQ0836078.1 DUF1064 domain-containing protein [Lactiplantibacillus pentosus]